ncbi:smoothelin isoform X2 [Chiloscyllium punctatum]|uniref:smoothelin isoform X2 n=1 Tax=Chiloscyllium punctatum TaxID=137246 RepID=UPI003B640874
MSADRYSALDETALRKLLEVTDDLDERRLIRSTICELRRKELKGMEEALSSKRFRSERANEHHENKENRQRQEDDQKQSLDILSGKLESIHDIDELTVMLRNAGEYAERKLIRAAIRKLREREIEAASMPNKPVGMLVHNRALQNERTTSTYPLNITSQTTWSTKDLPTNDKENVLQTQEGETESLGELQKVQAQAQELQNQRWRIRSESDEIASETVVLDPLKRVDDGSVKSIWGSRQRAESSCLDCHSFSTDSDLKNESYKDSKKYMTSNGSRGTLETHKIISTQYNDALQQNNPSSLNNENTSIKETEVFRKNRCASINNNENVIAGPLTPEREDMDSIFQPEISSRNVNLGSVQNWLNSDINDNIPSATTGRANDNNEENTCFMTLDNKIIYEDQTPRSIATPSKQKELTEKASGIHMNSTPIRKSNSIQDRMKKFTMDSPDQPFELGSHFCTQKRNEGRNSRILQQQQLFSGSPAIKIKEIKSSYSEISPKIKSAGLKDTWEFGKSIGKTDKEAEYLLSSRSSKLTGSNKRNGIERDRSTSLKENMFRFVQRDGKHSPQSGCNLIYSTVKSNFATAEVQKGPPRTTNSLISSTESLSNSIASDVLADESSKTRTFDKDYTKKPYLQNAVADKSYIRTPGRSNINKSQTIQPASEKDSSKTCRDSSVCLDQLSSAECSDVSARTINLLQRSFSGQKEKDTFIGNKDNMKTLVTIEVKEGQKPDVISARISSAPSSQRRELTFGLRATPFRMSGSSSMMMDTEQVMTEAAQSLQHIEAILPNGTEEKEKENNTKENKNKPGLEDLSAIEDEEVLDKMLDATTDYEERKIIRAAMRELRKKKRDEREKEREMRLQELKQKTDEKKGKSLNTAEMTLSKIQKSTDGKIVTAISKTEKITQADGGNRTLRTTTMESSILKKTDGGATVVQTKSSFTSSSTSSKKIGSIFDREDDARSSSVSALERKQAEKRKEVMRSQTLPRTSGTQARKALIEKLEKEGGSPGNPAIAKVKVQRSSSCGVPNANSIKQMLLDWCRAKTRGYEHVTIQNFSSSWSDGMAFCALVHNFFPEAFDYSELNPNNRRHNFEVAFKMAEKHADCPQLLDVEDMVRMKEPDWKCVYTYIQEYYRCLVQKGLVKTKTSS